VLLQPVRRVAPSSSIVNSGGTGRRMRACVMEAAGVHACSVIVLHERRVLHERCVVGGGSGERDSGFVSFLLACGPCGDALMCSVPVQLEVCSPSIHTNRRHHVRPPSPHAWWRRSRRQRKPVGGWRRRLSGVGAVADPRPQDKGLLLPADSAPQAARRM